MKHINVTYVRAKIVFKTVVKTNCDFQFQKVAVILWLNYKLSKRILKYKTT